MNNQNNYRSWSFRTFILLSLLALAGFTSAIYLMSGSLTQKRTVYVETDPYRLAFEQWKDQYGKTYELSDENELRFSIWRYNTEFIEEHNNDPTNTYTLSINRFADLTFEEWQALALGGEVKATLKPKPSNIPQIYNHVLNEIDWRAAGAVTEVKTQQNCASSWAFSAAGALEALQYIYSGLLVPLSEQQLIDCSKGFGNEGCGSGSMANAFDYASKNGIQSDVAYEYSDKVEKCSYDKGKVIFKNKGYAEVSKNDPLKLMYAVSMQPVSAAIDASRPGMQFYHGGIFDDSECGQHLNHGVLIVGYGVSKGVKYWLVKNSWGKDWGEDGYIRIIRSDEPGPGMCGIAKRVVYPIGNYPIGSDLIERDELIDKKSTSKKSRSKVQGKEEETVDLGKKMGEVVQEIAQVGVLKKEVEPKDDKQKGKAELISKKKGDKQDTDGKKAINEVEEESTEDADNKACPGGRCWADFSWVKEAEEELEAEEQRDEEKEETDKKHSKRRKGAKKSAESDDESVNERKEKKKAKKEDKLEKKGEDKIKAKRKKDSDKLKDEKQPVSEEEPAARKHTGKRKPKKVEVKETENSQANEEETTHSASEKLKASKQKHKKIPTEEKSINDKETSAKISKKVKSSRKSKDEKNFELSEIESDSPQEESQKASKKLKKSRKAVDTNPKTSLDSAKEETKQEKKKAAQEKLSNLEKGDNMETTLIEEPESTTKSKTPKEQSRTPKEQEETSIKDVNASKEAKLDAEAVEEMTDDSIQKTKKRGKKEDSSEETDKPSIKTVKSIDTLSNEVTEKETTKDTSSIANEEELNEMRNVTHIEEVEVAEKTANLEKARSTHENIGDSIEKKEPASESSHFSTDIEEDLASKKADKSNEKEEANVEEALLSSQKVEPATPEENDASIEEEESTTEVVHSNIEEKSQEEAIITVGTKETNPDTGTEDEKVEKTTSKEAKIESVNTTTNSQDEKADKIKDGDLKSEKKVDHVNEIITKDTGKTSTINQTSTSSLEKTSPINNTMNTSAGLEKVATTVNLTLEKPDSPEKEKLKTIDKNVTVDSVIAKEETKDSTINIADKPIDKDSKKEKKSDSTIKKPDLLKGTDKPSIEKTDSNGLLDEKEGLTKGISNKTIENLDVIKDIASPITDKEKSNKNISTEKITMTKDLNNSSSADKVSPTIETASLNIEKVEITGKEPILNTVTDTHKQIVDPNIVNADSKPEVTQSNDTKMNLTSEIVNKGVVDTPTADLTISNIITTNKSAGSDIGKVELNIEPTQHSKEKVDLTKDMANKNASDTPEEIALPTIEKANSTQEAAGTGSKKSDLIEKSITKDTLKTDTTKETSDLTSENSDSLDKKTVIDSRYESKNEEDQSLIEAKATKEVTEEKSTKTRKSKKKKDKESDITKKDKKSKTKAGKKKSEEKEETKKSEKKEETKKSEREGKKKSKKKGGKKE